MTLPRRAPEVWEQHERGGHMPKFPDCPVCIQEHGPVVKHFSSTTNGLHTLHFIGVIQVWMESATFWQSQEVFQLL